MEIQARNSGPRSRERFLATKLFMRQVKVALVLLLASLAGQTMAQSTPQQVAGTGWQALTSGSTAPAVAVSPTMTYVAWHGQSTSNIWFSSYNGSTWSQQETVGGSGWTAQTSASPALAWDFYKNELWLAWVGNTDQKIYFSIWNGSSWSQQVIISGSGWTAESTTAPTLIYDQAMYVAWKGVSSNNIWYTNWNYPGWSNQQTVSGSWGSAQTISSPALVGDYLGPVMLWKGQETVYDYMWASWSEPLEDIGFSQQVQVNCSTDSFTAKTSEAPAGVALGLSGYEGAPWVDVIFYNTGGGTLAYSKVIDSDEICWTVPAVVGGTSDGTSWNPYTYLPPAVSSAQEWSSATTTMLVWTNEVTVENPSNPIPEGAVMYMDPTTLPGLTAYH
jgi:hypothetical protein